MESVDLQAYIEHKTGCAIAELEQEPDRFRAIEEEALRDLVVMDAITGIQRRIIPGPHTLDNPECRRLMESHDTQNQ